MIDPSWTHDVGFEFTKKRYLEILNFNKQRTLNHCEVVEKILSQQRSGKQGLRGKKAQQYLTEEILDSKSAYQGAKADFKKIVSRVNGIRVGNRQICDPRGADSIQSPYKKFSEDLREDDRGGAIQQVRNPPNTTPCLPPNTTSCFLRSFFSVLFENFFAPSRSFFPLP